jgi:apolipoprotein N-acyltransferase
LCNSRILPSAFVATMDCSPPDHRWLSAPSALATGAAAAASFYAAYQWESAAGLVVLYLACMFRLAWVRSTRWAFYLGLTIGFLIAASQLGFFAGIFGPAAVGLWLVFGLWHAFFLLMARSAVGRWPKFGVLWIPLIWFALEYFRSELYYLRFAWLTPGFALAHPVWAPLAGAGVYGFSLLVMLGLTAISVGRYRRTGRWIAGICAFLLAAGIVAALPWSDAESASQSPLVVGIQLEGASDAMLLQAMESAAARYTQLDVLVLSEYAFDGPVPDDVRAWCRRHGKYLIAGGKSYIDEARNDYENTIYVIGPDGEEEFRQVKSVPVQFMQDGRPARSQAVWRSPWGRIGIAICYDLSYARVMDPLIRQGAQALIVPAMELIQWGEQEHRLHAKIALVRAREYGVPIFRATSSGVSQLVDRTGRVVASAPFPGQNEMIAGVLPIGPPGRQPLDRFLALPAVIAVAGLLVCLWVARARAR